MRKKLFLGIFFMFLSKALAIGCAGEIIPEDEIEGEYSCDSLDFSLKENFPKNTTKILIAENDEEPYRLEATVKNGKIVKTTAFYESGTIQRITPYKNGLRHGMRFIYGEDGVLSEEIPYVKNKAQGEGKRYYPSGKISALIPYKNDHINGVVRYFYESGVLYGEFEFKNDMRDGIAIWYCENGAIGGKGKYRNNELVGYFVCSNGKKGLDTMSCECP